MTTTPGDEIAYRTTPGGELWHPTGTPQDEATAVASDSIHRQLGASVLNAQDAMFDVVADLEARWTTSNIAIDTDGTPYISPGSMTTRILIDSDGTPYVAGVGA